MDRPKRQTATATPAKPGGLPLTLGFAANTKPDTVASARACLEAAAKREPSNPNVWEALANVIQQQRIWGWGLPPDEASVEKRSHPGRHLGSYSDICWYGPFPIAPAIQFGGSRRWPQPSRARRQPR